MKSFSCIQNLENRNYSKKEQENTICKRYETLLHNYAESLLGKDPEFKRFEAILSNESEVIRRHHMLKAVSRPDKLPNPMCKMSIIVDFLCLLTLILMSNKVGTRTFHQSKPSI